MKKLLLPLITSLIVVIPSLAVATPGIMKQFIAAYPHVEDSLLASCRTCHLPAEKDCLNRYGMALRDNALDFKAIEDQDADGDGAVNIEEIKARQLPGSQAEQDEILIFTNRIGAITFDHEKHSLAPDYLSEGKCTNCHSEEAFPRKFDNTVNWQPIAHPLCKGCHNDSDSPNAPMRCFECHDRERRGE